MPSATVLLLRSMYERRLLTDERVTALLARGRIKTHEAEYILTGEWLDDTTN